MSKVLKLFHEAILETKAYKKFFANHNPGERIFPNKKQESDLCYDAGEVAGGYKNIYLQVNSEARNTALKKYKSKYGTHSNIATIKVNPDTPEDKQEEEARKALSEARTQFSKKVG